MSMYDTISIDNKWIPENKRVPYDKQDYQTKSLDCYLNKYDILEDGRLIVEEYDEAEPMGSEILTPVIYTGEIHFYDDNYGFKAWCVNGIVKEVIDIS